MQGRLGDVIGEFMAKEQEAKKEMAAFDRVLMARHPERPYSMDVFSSILTDFVEIHGDRRYADDAALVTGFAKLDDIEVVVVGQQKGRDTNQRRIRNFGMPKPEGYRKALRVMRMAEKFGRPIITFIDTPGAYPGIDAEERGQAEAIAFNLREMANMNVPIIIVILGEGGSGGALAIGIGDRVLMMENAVYSVISPEGCAAILWKEAGQAARAAECLRLTATDLEKLGIIDEIVPESRAWKMDSEDEDKKTKNFDEVSATLQRSLTKHLKTLLAMDPKKRSTERYQKFRKMGEWV